MMNTVTPPNHFGSLIKFKAYEFQIINGALAEASLTICPWTYSVVISPVPECITGIDRNI